MKSQLLAMGKDKWTGRIEKDSAFRRLPAVEVYKIITNEYNPLLLELGIKLRLPKRTVRVPIKEQERLNDYMSYIIRRIRKLVSLGEYQKAWKVAWLNIKFSKAFRASAFNYVCKGWYYNMAQSEVWKLNRLVNKIIYNEDHDLNFRRVYIEKANTGKMRPLGVPAVEWRISLHLINGFFLELLKGQLLKDQHAYVPGKGVLTAWRRRIEVWKESNFVYGTDLKGFFDNVQLPKIYEVVKDRGCPENIRHWLSNLCKSTPQLTEEDQVDESNVRNKQAFYKGDMSSQWPLVLEAYKLPKGKANIGTPLVELEGGYNWNLLRNHMNEDNCKSLEEWAQTQWSLFDEYSPAGFGDIYKGVPQGMPMSPLLSILALKDYLSQQEPYVIPINYADDQEFGSKQDFVIKDDPSNGIVHATEKCSWLMRDGQITKGGSKFLGFRLTENWELVSETRKGIKAGVHDYIKRIYTAEGINRLRKVNNPNDLNNFVDWLVNNNVKNDPKIILSNLSKRNIFGFIMSCMNINDWTNDHALEDQRKAVRHHLEKLHKNSLTNRVPDNLDSSRSVPFLLNVINCVISSAKKRNKKA